MTQYGTARILQLAFDPTVRTPDDAAGERILDAALELIAASGSRNLTMDDVAAKARVGRMTVYRRFGGRQELIDALSVRECRRCLAAIGGAIDPAAPIQERASALFIAALRVSREHPLLERLARVQPEALLHELTRDNSAIFRLVRGFLVGLIEQAQAAGELGAGDAEIAAELAVRLGVSFVLMPHTALPVDDPERIRALVGDHLAPAILGAPLG
jgi:AcrR family transcriptional regulator